MVLQFIVVPVHIFRSFMRSWMGAGVTQVPVNRAQALAALVQSGANDVQSVVAQLEMEQEN